MRSRTTLLFAAAWPLIPLADAMSAPVPQRLGGGAPERTFAPLEEPRTIDGTGNHETFHERGAALTPLIRQIAPDYGDGVSAPAGADRASARLISNVAASQTNDRQNAAGLSDLFWQWGQFLDHDITETPIHSPSEPLPIAVPLGDPWFDPTGSGVVEISLSRSFPVRVDGGREQLNGITAWIDGSQIYGSEDDRAAALRRLDGTGRLKTSAGDLLPFNTGGFPNAPSDQATDFFLAGDVRANEQVGLTALHVLFMREHNFWAERIADEDRNWIRRMRAVGMGGGGQQGHGGNGGGRGLTADDYQSHRVKPLSGDEIYELARAIVSAELQRITYEEWMPHLLGSGALPAVSVYRPELDGSIRNSFATAAFRIGHSMLSTQLLRLDSNGSPIAQGHLPLASAFFTPSTVIETGIDPILRGLVAQRAQELDVYVIDDVRNFLFGPPGAGGFDLAALNMQRGRDHGLASYGDARGALGLGIPGTFSDVSSDPEVVDRLSRSARSPSSLDLWIGGLAEDHLPGALVGPTFHAILTAQFDALRDGDRLWYTRQLPAELIRIVERQTMARILRRNSGLASSEAADPFFSN